MYFFESMLKLMLSIPSVLFIRLYIHTPSLRLCCTLIHERYHLSNTSNSNNFLAKPTAYLIIPVSLSIYTHRVASFIVNCNSPTLKIYLVCLQQNVFGQDGIAFVFFFCKNVQNCTRSKEFLIYCIC